MVKISEMVSKKGGRCCSSGYYEETPFSPSAPASADDKWKRCCPAAPALLLALSRSHLGSCVLPLLLLLLLLQYSLLNVRSDFDTLSVHSFLVLGFFASSLCSSCDAPRPRLPPPNHLFVSCICKYFGVFFSSNTTYEDVALPSPAWPGISSNAWMTSSSSCCALHAFLVAAVVADYQFFFGFVFTYICVCVAFSWVSSAVIASVWSFLMSNVNSFFSFFCSLLIISRSLSYSGSSLCSKKIIFLYRVSTLLDFHAVWKLFMIPGVNRETTEPVLMMMMGAALPCRKAPLL